MIVRTQDGSTDFLIAVPSSLGASFAKLSAMPGRKRWRDRDLIFQPSGINLSYFIEHFPDAKWEEDAQCVLNGYMQLKMEEDNLRMDKRADLSDSSGYEFKTKPFEHQRHRFILARDQEAWAHLWDPGTGKSKVIIDTGAYNFEKGRIDRMLVVAPNGVHSNWIINEVPAHLPDRIPHWAGWYTAKLSDKKQQRLAANAINPGKLIICAFNVDGFVSDNAVSLLEHFLLMGPALLVIDESSRIKNYAAQRTKFLIKLGKLAAMRRILTGTDVTTGLENLFPQFKFLDSRILGHETQTTFRAEYCIMGGFENRVVTGYKSTEKLVKIIDGHSDRVDAEKCLDLPPKVFKRIQFEMTKEQRRLYDAYRKNSLEELQALLGSEKGLAAARELAITKFIRLHQIACYLTPEKNPSYLGEPKTNPRIKALMEALEDAGRYKRLIWCRFVADLRYIYTQLGKKAVPYWGEIKEADRIRSIERFQKDDSVQWFVSQQQAGGIGITLTAASGAVYHSTSSSLELREQSERRCRRIGSEGFSHIIYTDIEAARSIDQKILKRIAEKAELANDIKRDPLSAFQEDVKQMFNPVEE